MTSGRRRDVAYRAGLVVQMLGAAILAVLYPLGSPFYSTGIMLFELGVLLSAVTLRLSRSWFRKLLLGVVLAGLPVQIAGILVAPPELAGMVILAGIGLVCLGAAGMAGKEAYCFSFKEGWALTVLLPLVVLANLFSRENSIYNSLAFSTVFLLLLSLAGRKIRQPLPAACAADRCGKPGAV